uniref:Transporter n=1 Tax=Parastrongyloides trichosuri TaxID=131310 RepID=A0A0N5A1A8_PARTI
MSGQNSNSKEMVKNDTNGGEECQNFASQSLEHQTKARGEWGGRLYFLLTAIGCAVGLGNIWRFPYVAYENGASAFLIPYFLTSLLIGIPSLNFEMNFGQFSGTACSTGYKRLMPSAQGIGWFLVFNSFLIAIYYIMIMAYILIYLFTIAVGQGYTYISCDNPWNTINCVSSKKNFDCISNTTVNIHNASKAIFLNNECHFGNSEEEIVLIRDQYFAKHNGTPVSATEEFYDRYILQRTDSFDNLGQVNPKLFVSLFFSWVLIFLFSWKGVKILGKISVFTSLYPYVVVVAFFFITYKLEGAYEGMKYYLLEPDFSNMLNYRTWINAASQLIFSFSIGMGNMHSLASYNKRTHNIFIDVSVIALADIFMSIVGGAVVFSVLGFLASKTGKKIPEVVSSGATLAFVVYPEATSLMAYSELWAFAYFLMLFLLGASTQVVYVDLIATVIYDSVKGVRKYRDWIVLGLCVLMFASGIIFTFDGGVYYFTIFNDFVTGFNLLFVVILEFASVSVFYGLNNWMDDIRSMIGKPKNVISRFIGPTGTVMKHCWLYITPSLLGIVCLFLFYSFFNTEPTYGVGEKAIILPQSAKYFGYTLTFITLIPIPLFFLINYVKLSAEGKPFRSLFVPTENWPSYDKWRERNKDFDTDGASTQSTQNVTSTKKSNSKSRSRKSDSKSNNSSNCKKRMLSGKKDGNGKINERLGDVPNIYKALEDRKKELLTCQDLKNKERGGSQPETSQSSTLKSPHEKSKTTSSISKV